MLLRQLGDSDLKISRLGIGAWAMGGADWEFGWGPQDDEDSIAAIHRGIDCGMNWIDTAAVYGLGHSEEVVGRAIRGMGERPYVFTKCSLVWNEDRVVSHNLVAGSIKGEVERSLRRLGLEQIDLYQMHWPAWRGRPEGLAPGSVEEGIGAMADLQREGKIRYVGVSNYNAGQLERASAIVRITSLQPPYSLVNRTAEAETLPYAKEHGIGVIVYSPMASGLLSGRMTRERLAGLAAGDWRRRMPNFQEPLLSRNLELVERLRVVGERRKATPGQVAIAWALRNPAVTAAIVGVRRAEQVDGVIGAAAVELSDEEAAEIEGGAS